MQAGVKRTWLITGVIMLGLCVVVMLTQMTLFVIQPLGMVPEGMTVITWRTSKLRFIDSADAFCEREMEKVNVFCRLGTLAAVAQPERVLLRLPYSDTLYLWSTNGIRYTISSNP